MTRISYDQLKLIVISHSHSLPIQSLQHRVQQIAEHHLPSHHDLLPLRAIHSCELPEHLLILLEKWALLSPSKVDILNYFCNNFQGYSPNVVEAFDRYKLSLAGNRSCPCRSLPSVSQQQPQQYFGSSYEESCRPEQQLPAHYILIADYLSEELGKRWVDLGRQLPGMRSVVSDLLANNTLPTKTKIISMLEKLYEKTGGVAVALVLEGLAACKLNRQRDHLLSILPSS